MRVLGLFHAMTDAWRLLRARPLGNLAAVLVLAGGLSALLLVGALSDLLRGAVPDSVPAEEVFAFGVQSGGGRTFLMLPRDEALQLRAEVPGLADAALYGWSDFNLAEGTGTESGPAERVAGVLTDGDLFAVLGWPMAMGRGFRADDFLPGAAGAVVIGERLWRSRFGAAPDIVGRSIRLDGETVVVVGVLPPQRAFPFQNQVYRAIDLASAGDRGAGQWRTLARIGDPQILQQTHAAIAAVQLERERSLGEDALRSPIRLVREWEDSANPDSAMLGFVLLVVAGLVMLLAASNAGGLVLVQWLGRGRDLATRHALGATRARVLGGLLMHGVILVLLAWTLAAVLAQAGADYFNAFLWQSQSGIPLYMQVALSGKVLLVGLGAALLAVVCLVYPTWRRLRRGDLAVDLRSGSRGVGAPFSRLGAALFGLQTVLAVVTVLATLQALQGAAELLNRSLGLETEQVLVARFNVGDAERGAAFATRLREVLAEEPGVLAVSIAETIPMASVMQADVLRGDRRLRADYAPVDAGFREVYGLGLRSGRWFDANEIAEQKPVAVIDPVLAKSLFGDLDPVGMSFRREGGREPQELQVIGVSERVFLARHLGSDPPALFVPATVSGRGEFGLALRVQGAPQDYSARLQAIALGVDPDMALTDVGPYANLRAKELGWTRLVVGLFAPLGLLALVLAGTGLTALLGSLVAQRVREIGLRRALGARAPSLVRALLGRISIWGCGGLLVGIAFAFALVHPMGDSVYGRSPLDWFSVLGTVIVMLLALALAVALPLRRALRIEPTEALRDG